MHFFSPSYSHACPVIAVAPTAPAAASRAAGATTSSPPPHSTDMRTWAQNTEHRRRISGALGPQAFSLLPARHARGGAPPPLFSLAATKGEMGDRRAPRIAKPSRSPRSRTEFPREALSRSVDVSSLAPRASVDGRRSRTRRRARLGCRAFELPSSRGLGPPSPHAVSAPRPLADRRRPHGRPIASYLII